MDTTPMPITTYSQLQSAVGLWLGHGLFASTIPDFIALFEAAANRRLRVRQMDASVGRRHAAGRLSRLAARHLRGLAARRARLRRAVMAARRLPGGCGGRAR